MHDKIVKTFTGLFALTLLIVFNSFPSTSNLFSSISNNFISYAQQINSTDNGNLSIGSNHTVLSLIPLMIKEMENTNATSIPIKQVISATPSNVTAIQNMVKNNLLNNISKNNIPFLNTTSSASLNNNTVRNNPILNTTSSNSSLSNFNPKNKTDLIPVVINLTKNTNATSIPIKQVISATPSNVTALQNMAKNNPLNNISGSNTISNILNNIRNNNTPINNTDQVNSSNFNPKNKTDLIPVVINLTKNTNATDIAMAKTFNATPSNVTALQKFSKNNFLNNISNTISNTMSLSNTKNLTR
jgi:hypothetical protein